MFGVDYKRSYIELLLRSGVLRFGEFKTKSGRLSPYFFNMGNLDSGESLGAAADLYATAIVEHFGEGVDNLFGPAYKGIPLAVMTSAALARRIGRDVSFTFNRKEAKDHGEGGLLVGRSYQGGERVVVIEDVVTGGTSFRETLPMLKKHGVDVAGVIVGVDRQERGEGSKAALREVADTYGVKAASIVTITDVVATLYRKSVLGQVWIDDAAKARIDRYLAEYGAV